MSTGLGCAFVEHKPNEWYLLHEEWSQRDEYVAYGPFPSQEKALDYLDDYFANPGGWTEHPYEPDSPHGAPFAQEIAVAQNSAALRWS